MTRAGFKWTRRSAIPLGIRRGNWSHNMPASVLLIPFTLDTDSTGSRSAIARKAEPFNDSETPTV